MPKGNRDRGRQMSGHGPRMAWRQIAQDGLIKRTLPERIPVEHSSSSPGGSRSMDGIVNVLQYAVDGVAQQQQATANNLSNSQTPGFTTHEVAFETSFH